MSDMTSSGWHTVFANTSTITTEQRRSTHVPRMIPIYVDGWAVAAAAVGVYGTCQLYFRPLHLVRTLHRDRTSTPPLCLSTVNHGHLWAGVSQYPAHALSPRRCPPRQPLRFAGSARRCAAESPEEPDAGHGRTTTAVTTSRTTPNTDKLSLLHRH